MRYYLDTNILVFILLKQQDNLDRHTMGILEDYSNFFYVSPIVVRELILLYKTGELKNIKCKSCNDVFTVIDELNYEIKPFARQHVMVYAQLELVADHKDPNDHMIIAQAIADRIPVISSDRKFRHYEKQGLKFVFNKR